MKIYYENSLMQKFDMSDFPVAIEDITSLFEKEWEYEISERKDKNFSNIKQIYRTSLKVKTKLLIFADSESEYKQLMNDFESITEIDVMNKKFGKLWVNDYYLECMIVATSLNDYEENFYSIENEITIVSVKPFWCKDTEFEYNIQSIQSSNNKRYGYRYGVRYANGMTGSSIYNSHFVECNFKLRIYGPVANPQVNIGGNRYCINTVVEPGERVEVDTRAEEIYKISRYGDEQNIFHARELKKEFFKKIGTGRNEVLWTGEFKFDIVLTEERSAPRW